jgi:conjugal transfer pilus assembly protein TraD
METQLMLFDRFFPSFFPSLTRDLYLGEGVPLEDLHSTKPRIVRLKISDSDRKRHWITFGTTGTGKTRLLEFLVEQDIRGGKNVCVVDPKGDKDLLAKIIEVSRDAGRERELMILTPVFPELSIKVNPFSHWYRPEEIVQHVVAGIPVGREPFFLQVAREVTLVTVFASLFLKKKSGEPLRLTIRELRDRVGREALLAVKEQLRDYRDDPEVDEIYASLDQVTQSEPDYFSKITSSLRTVLTQLTVGSIGRVVGSGNSNEFIKRLEAGERVILVAQTGSLMFRDAALILARIFTSMIQALVGRFYASQRRIEPNLMFYLDEASSVLYQGIEDMFNKSRGAGVAIHALTQSVADVEASIGPAHARKLFDNAGTKLFFQVKDPTTGKYVSDLAGSKAFFSPILSMGGGITVRELTEALLDEADALRLSPRQFFLFTRNEAYRGRTPEVEPARLTLEWPDPAGV